MSTDHACQRDKDIEKLTRNEERNSIAVATMTEKLNYMQSDITEIKIAIKALPDAMDKKYATKEELNSLREKIKDNTAALTDKTKDLKEEQK